jgi:tetratricopeptide (TPR) repeat protein
MIRIRDIVLSLLCLALLSSAPIVYAQQNAAVPEEALRYRVQADTVFKQAQSKDDYTQAVSLYQKALQVAPTYGDAWFNLSKAQEKLEQYDDAIASLKRFIQYSPNDPGARSAQNHIYELEATRDLAAKHAPRVIGPGPNDHLIIPGERVGQFTLGMDEQQLLTLENPNSREAASIPDYDPPPTPHLTPATKYCYYDQYICLYVDRATSKVVQILIGYKGDCHGYRMSDGTTCGMTYSQLSASAAIGTPEKNVYNDFHHHALMNANYRTPSGAITTAQFFGQNASYADPEYNTVQQFELYSPGYQ